jgi:hypothetical protein
MARPVKGGFFQALIGKRWCFICSRRCFQRGIIRWRSAFMFRPMGSILLHKRCERYIQNHGMEYHLIPKEREPVA